MTAEHPLACNLLALSTEARSQHIDVTRRLFAAVQEVRELANGYQFLVQADLGLCTEFVQNERLCCPFFGFRIELEPEETGLKLSLVGRSGIKAFIRAEWGDAVSSPVLW